MEPATPQTPVFVDVFDESQLLATVPADAFGKDLLDAGIGNGRHRFEFVTPRRVRARRDLLTHVYFSGTKIPLIGSPRRVPQQSLDTVEHGLPTNQALIDIFSGDWISSFPPEAGVSAGALDLFHAPHIEWALGLVGDLRGAKIVELGPLEGGHTHMLVRRGARVVAVEANRRNFLKCLITKELLKMSHADFLCGDIVEFLRDADGTFDVCLASGVLYHMENPAELIALIARHARQLVLWTHYFDEDLCSRGLYADHFVEHRPATFDGFDYTQHRQQYGDLFFASNFCGGTEPTSSWMSRDDILGCLRYFGLKTIRGIAFEDRDNALGPSFCVVAGNT